jgi:UPF0042 nucleotide-binding protein
MTGEIPADPDRSAVVIVTGLSGAGISSALKHLEELVYEVFDKFPLTLAHALVHDPLGAGRLIAIGIDTRSRGFQPEAVLDAARGLNARLLFLTADEAALQRRFTETRRRHPLATDRPVSAGIRREIEWLYPLRNAADFVIDTSDLSIHDLRRVLENSYALNRPARLTVTLMSFAYRHGLPREADIVFDTRFLRNPHWDKDLKALTGLDEQVRAYVAQDPAFAPFVQNLKALLEPLLPRYAQEGKSYLTIAFGCSGGRHRSVTLAETLMPWVAALGFPATVSHRDVNRVAA